MKEMTIRVSDELAELVERWTVHTPEMEVIDTSDCLCDDERDQCFKQAIMELTEEGVIRRPRDYAWIMAAIDQDVIAEYESFNSSQAFIDYMKIVGITKLPIVQRCSEPTISLMASTRTGCFSTTLTTRKY